MPPPPDLPPELLEITFVYLQDNRASIRACALVCTNWHQVAAAYLFRSATIAHDKQDFFDYLINKPTLCRHFRQLGLRDAIASETFFTDDVLKKLDTLIPMLCNVTSLKLNGIKFRVTGLIKRLSSAFGHIQELYCTNSQLQRDATQLLVTFFSTFQSLQILELGSFRLKYEYDATFNLYTGPLQLSPALRVYAQDCHSTHGSVINRWLLSHDNIPAIENLTLSYLDESAVELVHALHSTLRNLQVTLADQSSVTYPNDIDLSRSTQLRSMSFTAYMLSDSPLSSPLMTVLHQLLSTMSSAAFIETINLSFFVVCVLNNEGAAIFLDTKNLINWARLDSILQSPHFAGLKRIGLEIAHVGPSQKCNADFVRRLLPKCDARGVLFL